MHRITTIDVHVAGEPLRVITNGFPEPLGKTILDKRSHLREHSDHLRRALMWEPRGHPDMYGCLLVPPSNPEADFGVLFMHNEGYSTMCGHGIIGLVTVLVDQKMIQGVAPETTVRLETPSGLVTATALVREGRVKSVRFRNVPSFVCALDQTVEVTGIGSVRYDLAFGGAFYAFCRAEDLSIELSQESSRHLVDLGMGIKKAIMLSQPIKHPIEPDLSFLYGTIFVGISHKIGTDCRQVCIFAEGALDRSPTGTGVSAHLAILAARGRLKDKQPYVIESILGTTFIGRIVKRLEYHSYPAIIPEIEGSAYMTGRHEFLIDPNDPLQQGFLLG